MCFYLAIDFTNTLRTTRDNGQAMMKDRQATVLADRMMEHVVPVPFTLRIQGGWGRCWVCGFEASEKTRWATSADGP